MRFTVLLLLPLLGASPLPPPHADEDAASLEDLEKRLERSLSRGAFDLSITHIESIAALETPASAKLLLQLALRLDRLSNFEERQKLRIFRLCLKRLSESTAPDVRAYLFDESARRDRKTGEVRKVLLLRVLAGMTGADADEAIVAALQKTSYRSVKVLAVRALVERGDPRSTPALREILRDWKGRRDVVWRTVSEGLRTLAPPTPDPRSTKTSPDPGEAAPAMGVVFVIDVSLSMHRKDPEPGTPAARSKPEPCPDCRAVHGWQRLPEARRRMERAKEAAIRMIRELRPESRFNVITGVIKGKAWREGKELHPARKKEKEEAIEWVRGLRWG